MKVRTTPKQVSKNHQDNILKIAINKAEALAVQTLREQQSLALHNLRNSFKKARAALKEFPWQTTPK
jgi:hypothetical protein